MARHWQGWSFGVSDVSRSVQSDPVHPAKEEIMRDPVMLSFEEAEARARGATEEFEVVLNRVDSTPTSRKQYEERHRELTSLFLTFLAGRYGIAAPASARVEIDSE